jgi:hypothetical protein
MIRLFPFRYQFDQRRRAKHSTMMLLYHLHNPTVPLYLYTCNECQSDILRYVLLYMLVVLVV